MGRLGVRHCDVGQQAMPRQGLPAVEVGRSASRCWSGLHAGPAPDVIGRQRATRLAHRLALHRLAFFAAVPIDGEQHRAGGMAFKNGLRGALRGINRSDQQSRLRHGPGERSQCLGGAGLRRDHVEHAGQFPAGAALSLVSATTRLQPCVGSVSQAAGQSSVPRVCRPSRGPPAARCPTTHEARFRQLHPLFQVTASFDPHGLPCPVCSVGIGAHQRRIIEAPEQRIIRLEVPRPPDIEFLRACQSRPRSSATASKAALLRPCEQVRQQVGVIVLELCDVVSCRNCFAGDFVCERPQPLTPDVDLGTHYVVLRQRQRHLRNSRLPFHAVVARSFSTTVPALGPRSVSVTRSDRMSLCPQARCPRAKRSFHPSWFLEANARPRLVRLAPDPDHVCRVS